MEQIIALALLALLSSLFVFSYRWERDAWNGGICAATGEAWESFDVDSGGSVGYKSGKDNCCWIGWDVENPTFRNSPLSYLLAQINLVVDRKFKPAA